MRDNQLYSIKHFRARAYDQINQVITYDSIKPIFDSYFNPSEFAELDVNKVEIALYSIRSGFEYMKRFGQHSKRDLDGVDEALEVSESLARTLENRILRGESGND